LGKKSEECENYHLRIKEVFENCKKWLESASNVNPHNEKECEDLLDADLGVNLADFL